MKSDLTAHRVYSFLGCGRQVRVPPYFRKTCASKAQALHRVPSFGPEISTTETIKTIKQQFIFTEFFAKIDAHAL